MEALDGQISGGMASTATFLFIEENYSRLELQEYNSAYVLIFASEPPSFLE